MRLKGLSVLSSILLMLCATASHASMDVLFDYSASKSTQGSGSNKHLNFSSFGVKVYGFDASNGTSKFKNRTSKLKTSSSYHGLILDKREWGNHNMIDNSGRLEMVIFEFDQLVSLKEIKMGRVGGDFDFTLLAHQCSSFNRSNFSAGGSSNNMLSQGWQLVGHHGNGTRISGGKAVTSVNSGHIASSIWAISAYHSAFSDSSRHLSHGWLGNGNDYFSLMQLAGKRVANAAVSEPSGLAILLLAGIAAVGLRRRRQLAAAA